jgi:hypothetical protein
MTRWKHRARARRRDAGYALLMVVFFSALVLITAVTLAPNVLTEGRREKEEEMVWRGKQYIRGIRLYYRKTGRFPQSLEDLAKPKIGLRFMRQAYKDPINAKDGSWRLIYVGPAGQLIGSLKQRTSNLQIPTAGQSPGNPQTPPGMVAAPGSSTPTPPGQGTPPAGEGNPENPAQQAAPEMTGPIIGGNIIGVGSKIARRSIRIYDGGKTYREWEFIWDPSKDTVTVGQPGTQIGTPAGNPPGGMPVPNPNPAPPPNQ